MLYSIQSQSITIDNYSIDFITLPVYEMENKLRILLPKVDRGANWFGAIGIFVSAVLGVASYLCTDIDHRPSLGWIVVLSLAILVTIGFAGYLLYKSYNAVGVEKIMEELKKDSSRFDIKPNNEEREIGKDEPKPKAELTSKSNNPAIVFKPQGKRKKKRGNRNK